jgi:hypothetical protein
MPYRHEEKSQGSQRAISHLPFSTTSGTLVTDGTTLLFRGSTADCTPCQFRAQCCPKTPVRKVPRSIYERSRDVARSLAGTEAFEQSRRDRKRIEMRFAHLKRIFRLGRHLRRLAKLATQLPTLTAPYATPG